MASEAKLASLLFGPVLNRPTLITAFDRQQFGAFVDRFEHVISPPLPSFYTDKKTGDSVWLSPEALLAVLLSNEQIDRSLKPRRWFCVPSSPLVFVWCKHGSWLLANTLNNHVINSFDISFLKLLPLEVRKSIQKEALEGSLDIPYDDSEIAIQDLLYSSKKIATETQGNAIDDDAKLGKRDITKVELPVLDKLPLVVTHTTEPTDLDKQAFFSMLKENNIPILGDTEGIFNKLSSNSKDPRMIKIPENMRTKLLQEYMQTQRTSIENQAAAARLALKAEVENLIAGWHKINHSSPKFKTTYSLFKEKYKHTPCFKNASKYFDIEKIFKEACNALSTGTLPMSMKNSIEGFLAHLKTIRGLKFAELLKHPSVASFPGLTADQKEQIAKEWRTSLPVTDP